MLRSQNGYLKHKLAKLQPQVNTNDKSVPTIYVITPTYARPQQKAELTRLCHTFLLVPNIHWIVIEDAKANTKLVQNLLANCGVVYTLIFEETPSDQKLKPTDKNWAKPRGVHQRNAGNLTLRYIKYISAIWDQLRHTISHLRVQGLLLDGQEGSG